MEFLLLTCGIYAKNSLRNMDRAPFADNPSQGLIPLSITPLCANRMNGWATIVSHLIKYLSIVVGIADFILEQEKRLSESLNKTSHDLSAALASENLTLFAQDESVRVFGLLM